MPWRRNAFSWLLAKVTAVLSLLCVFYIFVLPQILRFRFRSGLSWYDLGLYGFGPSQKYISFEYESPVVEISQRDAGCHPGLTFLAPRGDSIAHPGPMILDAQGNLVWMKHNRNITMDFKMQRYRGQDYLTYWEGDAVDGIGHGSWRMLNQSYEEAFEINPVGDFDGDLHEFQITDDNTALLTIYDTIPTDLTSIGGPSSGWIYDCIFQEVDIATGELIFEWRASLHYPINSTFEELKGRGKTQASAFDFFHINSVHKDSRGDYLISARHTHIVSTIDHVTGEVLWNLGGTLNGFTDLSHGAATDFSWQHDARWHNDTIITLFDNAASSNENATVQSRAMILELNIPNRQVALRAAYYHPQELKAVSQGNVQILEGSGNTFVGWGHSAAYTEFDTNDGTVLCDVHFGASAYFTFGRVVSYRAYKGSWIGRPLTSPAAKIVRDNNVYVSWNGATEVVSWRLEAGDARSPDLATFESVGQFEKQGFETKVGIPEDAQGPYFRLLALDWQGTVLGHTDIFEKKMKHGSEYFYIACYWILLVASIPGVWYLVSRILQRRRGWHHGSLLRTSIRLQYSLV